LNALWLVALGVAAGALSGMGIGGGAILIPALTMLFGMTQHGAQGVNLVYFLPTAGFAVFIHAKGGNIKRQGLGSIIAGGVVGAAAGSLIALAISADMLRYIFAAFLLITGIIEFFKK